MAKANLARRPSAQEVHDTVALDDATGELIWRVTRGRAIAGRPAAPLDKSTGYRRVKIGGQYLMATHVVWFIKTGKWPERLDHQFGDKGDMDFDRLRSCSQSQNRANTGKPSNNTSGLKGVVFHKASGKWAAQIGKDGKSTWLGCFDTKEAAAIAYADAAKRLYGEFARTEDFVAPTPMPTPPPRRPVGRPTYEDVAAVLSYDSKTGEIRWKAALGFRGQVGELAGRIGPDGYRRVGLWWKQYQAHWIAWLLMTKEWPTKQIEHRNRVRDDNRWKNIRQSNQSQNIANTGISPLNTSGFKGVSPIKESGLWGAWIKVNGRGRFLGKYSTPEEAYEVYKREALKAWGEFARFE